VNRLRDMDGDEPLSRRGSELLRSVAPTTTATPVTEMKQRVWRSLQHPPAAAPRRLPSFILKLAIVAIVALGAGTAGAVIARRWIVPRFHSQGVAGAPARPERMTPTRPTAPTPQVAPAPVEAPAVETPPPKPAARPTVRRVASAAPSAAAVARERTEVLDALVALRREHDPARAGTLLARYLSAHPRGAMREEALALAIEAADARGDRVAAAQLAQAYQAEFPAGRFLIFARSHLDRGASH
jgi:hypothetical protein